MERLLQELEAEAANKHALEEAQCCYGPPDWDGSSAGGPWGAFQEGEEVCYTAQLPAAAAAALPAVTHRKGAVRLQLYRQPFAVGGMKRVFYARWARWSAGCPHGVHCSKEPGCANALSPAHACAHHGLPAPAPLRQHYMPLAATLTVFGPSPTGMPPAGDLC